MLLARTIASNSSSRSARVAILQLPRSCLHQQKEQLPQLQQQLQAANSLHHPHVVRLHEVMLSCEHLNLVTDYCSSGSLLQYVQQRGALVEAFARWFFQQLVLGVDYCHSKGVWGLDLQATQLQVRGKTCAAQQSRRVCLQQAVGATVVTCLQLKILTDRQFTADCGLIWHAVTSALLKLWC
jgi:serine/threonine protein kinase